MKGIKEILNEHKVDFNKLEIPEELEERLNKALVGREKNSSKKFSWQRKLIAICLVMFLVGYNFNTLAYYGKKLIGFDTVMDGTLRQLNELGKGQVIEESHTFSNGVTFILDGIMIDQNQFLAFYTVTDSSGELDFMSLNPRMQLKGLFKRYFMGGGSGEMDEELHETKWIMSFEPPSFYERNLNLEVSMLINGQMEQGNISFKLDRSKAMKSTLKQSINKTFKAEGTKVHFDSISASPTTTIIDGSIQNIFELAKDQLSGERMRPNNLDVKLVANGQEVTSKGGSLSTDMKGITFTTRFDALPDNLQSLQIQLESLSVDKDVNKTIDISENGKDYVVEIQGQNIEINQVYESSGSTYVKFTTDESVILTRVYLLIDGEKTGIKQTLESELDKHMDGSISHTRVMHFPKTGEKYQLLVERMTYQETYNEIIEIPIK